MYEPVHEAQNQSKNRSCNKFLHRIGSFINYGSMDMHLSEIGLKPDQTVTFGFSSLLSARPSGRSPLYPNVKSQNRILAIK